jgi:hypothetical protein
VCPKFPFTSAPQPQQMKPTANTNRSLLVLLHAIFKNSLILVFTMRPVLYFGRALPISRCNSQIIAQPVGSLA